MMNLPPMMTSRRKWLKLRSLLTKQTVELGYISRVTPLWLSQISLSSQKRSLLPGCLKLLKESLHLKWPIDRDLIFTSVTPMTKLRSSLKAFYARENQKKSQKKYFIIKRCHIQSLKVFIFIFVGSANSIENHGLLQQVYCRPNSVFKDKYA